MLRAGRWRRGVILALAITVGAVFVYLGLLADSLVLYLSPYGIPCILGGDLALSKAPFDSQVWKGNSPTGYDSGHPPSLRYQMARSLLDSYLRPGMSEAQVLELLGEPELGTSENPQTNVESWTYKLGYPFKYGDMWDFYVDFDSRGRMIRADVDSSFAID